MHETEKNFLFFFRLNNMKKELMRIANETI